MSADLAVDALATARLTRLLVEDRIPFGAWRDRFVRRAGDDSRLAELVSCQWCTSVHVAAFVMVARRYRWWRPVATALAFSQVAGMAAHYVET